MSTPDTTDRVAAAMLRPLRWDASMTGRAPMPGDEFGLPIGTVTFLLTDIEGSTLAWAANPTLMGPAVARHYAILDDAVAAHCGVRPQEQGEGDSIVAAFSRASDAVRAAVEAQQQLAACPWPDGLAPLKVRMAVHAGEAQLRNEANYVGQTIIRTARLRALAHGGQIIASQTVRDLTVDQLGDEIELVDLGMHRLKDLARPEHVWQVVVPGEPHHFPPLRSLNTIPNNLPMSLSSFVGRQAEIAAVMKLSGENRLVTITGTGGAGKTRLAQQVAANLADRFADGAWWIDLAPQDPTAVRRATAEVLSIKEPDALVARLAARTALLVFDNCEHVVETAAPLIDEILRSCPDIRIIATSRGMLDVAAEVTWRLPPLSLPVAGETHPVERLAQFDAVQLFLDRARKARPTFILTNENGPAVAEICARLDGLPLAIELAAARAKSLTPQQILSGLENALSLLTGGSRLVLPRQQTLEASIAWSHDLLAPTEQVLLRRLSVFVDGCDLAAAEAVCADGHLLDSMLVLDGLERLIDQSLLRVEEHGARSRFLLLETVRQFGAARLVSADEELATKTKHATYFVRLAEEHAVRCEGPDEDAAIELLAPEHSNFAELLRFTAAHRSADDLARTVLTLSPLWNVGSRPLDGIAACTTALDLLSEHSNTLRVALLQARCGCKSILGQLLPMYADGSAAVELAESAKVDLPIGRARFSYSSVLTAIDPDRYWPIVHQAIDEMRAVGDLFGVAGGLNRVAAGPIIGARTHEARQQLDEAYDVAFTYGNPSQMFDWCIWEVAHCSYVADQARSAEVLELARRIRPESLPLRAFEAMARVQYSEDRGVVGPTWEELEALMAELERAELVIVRGALQLSMFWWLHLHGEYERARALAERHHESGLPGLRNVYMILFGALSSCALGEFDRASEKLEDAGAIDVSVRPQWFTSARHVAALIAIERGELAAAEAEVHQALEVSHKHEHPRDVIVAFEFLAIIARANGSWVEAARLAGFVEAHRSRLGLRRRLEPVSSQFDQAVDATRTALGPDDFARSHGDGAGLSLDAAIEFVSRARGERGRPTIGWAALTPTERRVADLVREGKSNAQVASELLMGVETVKTHLSRVYAKLGVANRTQLTALKPPQ